MLKTICYISDSYGSHSYEDLKMLYEKAKKNNQKNEITGVLIYNNGNFLQVLEGHPERVDATYSRIELDYRHQNIFKVININIEQRIFEDYNFGFTIIDDFKEFSELNQYLEWLKNAENKVANKVITVVENFIGSMR
ncbi:BLUF domain-containing protein [Hyunsoonleella rubra]|uniref:BLUF domain-containing protein n=1 Tax=Hyunsoonleella rubra TaxID=1737062 RepID=A0ABW5TC49_9FLAO